MKRLLLLLVGLAFLSACSSADGEKRIRYSLDTIEYMEAACLHLDDLELDEEGVQRLYDQETNDLRDFMEEYSGEDWILDYTIMLRESWNTWLKGDVEEAIHKCEEAVEFRKQYFEPTS